MIEETAAAAAGETHLNIEKYQIYEKPNHTVVNCSFRYKDKSLGEMRGPNNKKCLSKTKYCHFEMLEHFAQRL